MAGSDDNTDLPEETPPEVPEEFAAAYREAYLRALQQEGTAGEVDEVTPAVVPGPDPQPEPADRVQPEAPPAAAAAAGAGRHRVTEYRSASPLERASERTWFVPLVAVLIVLALILVGWVVGRLLGSGGGEPSGRASEGPAPRTPSWSHTGDKSTAPPAPPRFRGPVAPVEVATVAATCTMDSGVDAAGHRVGYDAANAIDGDATTAWRCDGDAIGERLVLILPAGTKVAALGLIPGYAKTDPANGKDRYAENNRIVRIRWTLGPGESFVQRLDGSAEDRELQLRRIPVTETGRVVLEILDVEEGDRGATAISELRVATPS